MLLFFFFSEFQSKEELLKLENEERSKMWFMSERERRTYLRQLEKEEAEKNKRPGSGEKKEKKEKTKEKKEGEDSEEELKIDWSDDEEGGEKVVIGGMFE